MDRDAQFVGDILRGEQCARRGRGGLFAALPCRAVAPDERHDIRRNENLFAIGAGETPQAGMWDFNDFRHGDTEQMRDMRRE